MATVQTIKTSLTEVLSADLANCIDVTNDSNGVKFSFTLNDQNNGNANERDLIALARFLQSYLANQNYNTSGKTLNQTGTNIFGNVAAAVQTAATGNKWELTVTPQADAAINLDALQAQVITFATSLQTDEKHKALWRSGAVKDPVYPEKEDLAKKVIDAINERLQAVEQILAQGNQPTEEQIAELTKLITALTGKASALEAPQAVNLQPILDQLKAIQDGLPKSAEAKTETGSEEGMQAAIAELRVVAEQVKALTQPQQQPKEQTEQQTALKDALLAAFGGNLEDIKDKLALLETLPQDIRREVAASMQGASQEDCKQILAELLETVKLLKELGDKKVTGKARNAANVDFQSDSEVSWQEKLGFGKGLVNVSVGGNLEVHTNSHNTTSKMNGSGGESPAPDSDGSKGGSGEDKSSEKKDDSQSYKGTDMKKDAPKPEDKKPEDPHLGKKVDHAHNVINQQINADKESIEQKVKAESEARLKSATEKLASTKKALNKAQANYNRYGNGPDVGKIGLTSFVAAGVAFLALVFVNPIAAAAVAATVFIGAVTAQVFDNNEKKTDSAAALRRAEKALHAAESEEASAKKEASPDQAKGKSTIKFSERLQEERSIAETRAGMTTVA